MRIAGVMVLLLLVWTPGHAATLAADDFTRANSSDIGTAWDVMTGESPWTLTSNHVSPANLNADSTETSNAVAWPNDQWAQATITENSTTGGGRGTGLCLRGSTTARTYYRIVISKAAANNIEIAKFLNGAYTSLAYRTGTFANGDVLYAEVQGTTLLVKLNGVQIGATVTDSSIASGRPGISYSSTGSGSQLDNWSAGDFTSGTPPNPITNVQLQFSQTQGIPSPVTFAWDYPLNPDPDLVGGSFELYRDTATLVATVAYVDDQTTFTAQDAAPPGAHCWKARATLGAMVSDFSDEVCENVQ